MKQITIQVEIVFDVPDDYEVTGDETIEMPLENIALEDGEVVTNRAESYTTTAVFDEDGEIVG